MKIAIVEDDQAIAQMYRIKFENEGYSVQIAENGKREMLCARATPILASPTSRPNTTP
jgi:DNA-binding response OmpR family regulator